MARPASKQAVRELTELYQAELADYQDRRDGARQLATEPLGPLPPELTPEAAAAWTTVANVLLNLDGVLTKN